METPRFLMAPDQAATTTNQETARNLFGYEGNRPESTKTRGRKSTRGQNQKKLPQRGLGVAQLERIRIQDRWKKMTEVPQFHPESQMQLQNQTPILPYADPSGHVPVLYGAPHYGAPSPMVNGCGGQLMVQRVGNYGGGFGGSCGIGGYLVADQVVGDPYGGVGAPDPRVFVDTKIETSKELSSMPKMQCGSQRCDVCFKKKRFVGFNGGRDKHTENPNTPNFTGGTSNFGPKGARRAGHAGRNLDEGVEVVAVHRKGNSMGGSVFMEYEFFPGKSGRGASSKEMELTREASLAVGGEASNSVDLSLKLSN